MPGVAPGAATPTGSALRFGGRAYPVVRDRRSV